VDYNFTRDKAFDASGASFKMYGFIQEDGKVYSNAYFEANVERHLTEIFEIKPGVKITKVALGAADGGGSPVTLK
jgi:hypothetical protein